jgi:hypothetical protein
MHEKTLANRGTRKLPAEAAAGRIMKPIFFLSGTNLEKGATQIPKLIFEA